MTITNGVKRQPNGDQEVVIETWKSCSHRCVMLAQDRGEFRKLRKAISGSSRAMGDDDDINLVR